MRIDIVTCCPDLLVSPFAHSIIKRALDKNLVKIQVHDLRDHGIGKHCQVDDYPYGGGGGMVLMTPPIVDCFEQLHKKHDYDEVIYLSPDGELFTQSIANELSLKKIYCF